MDCKNVKEKLSAYIEGDISSEEKMLIDEHLRSCQKCDESLAELRKTVDYVRSLEDIEPPPWLIQKVMAKIKSGSKPRERIWQKLFYPLYVKLPIEVVGVILIAVTTIYIFKTIQPEIKVAKTPSEETTPQILLQEKVVTEKELESKEDVIARDRVPKQSMKLQAGKAPKKETPLTSARKEEKSYISEEKDRVVISQYPEKVGKEISPPVSPPLAKAGKGVFGIEQQAPSPSAKQEQAVPSAGVAAKDESKRRTFSEALQAKTSAEKKNGIIGLAVKVEDMAAAGREIEKIITNFGGKIIKKESIENKDIFTVEFASRKLKELIVPLGRIGEVEETMVVSEDLEGIIEIKIEVARILKQ